MKEPELTDKQIMLITKAALDNNASIIQFASQTYGLSKDVKPHYRKKWHEMFLKQWEQYDNTIREILDQKH